MSTKLQPVNHNKILFNFSTNEMVDRMELISPFHRILPLYSTDLWSKELKWTCVHRLPKTHRFVPVRRTQTRVDHGSGPSAGRVTKSEKTSGSGRVMSF